MKYFVLLITLVIITGCSSDLDTKVKNLVEGKNKWIVSAPYRNYSYIYKAQCHCTNNNEKIKIQVRSGNVISAKLKDGSNIKGKYLRSMKQHFEYIFEILKQEEREKSATIEVKYDKSLGYPSMIKTNIKGLSHGRSTIYISDVVIQ